MIATLGNAATKNNENLNTTKLTPICFISEWTNEAQKMASVAILLGSSLQEKCVIKVTMAECGNKLEIEIAFDRVRRGLTK